MENWKAYQCCYTNLSQDAMSGWQNVAVSGGLKKSVIDRCTQYQNINSPRMPQTLDEDGNDLNLFEIIGEDRQMFIMRTKYGMVDIRGRANCFSHAFIIRYENDFGREFLSNPANFVSIEPGNFKDNANDAKLWDESYGSLKRIVIDPLHALEAAGLTWESYRTLMQCVYYQLTSTKFKPLYIQYDGSFEQMASCLYCIYSGIPLYMRRLLHVSSCTANNDAGIHLIFSKHAADKPFYFITGQDDSTNLPTDEIAEIFDKEYYLSFALQTKTFHGMNQFFKNLEIVADAFDDPSGMDRYILHLSYYFMKTMQYKKKLTNSEAKDLVEVLKEVRIDDSDIAEMVTDILSASEDNASDIDAETLKELHVWLHSFTGEEETVAIAKEPVQETAKDPLEDPVEEPVKEPIKNPEIVQKNPPISEPVIVTEQPKVMPKQIVEPVKPQREEAAAAPPVRTTPPNYLKSLPVDYNPHYEEVYLGEISEYYSKNLENMSFYSATETLSSLSQVLIQKFGGRVYGGACRNWLSLAARTPAGNASELLKQVFLFSVKSFNQQNLCNALRSFTKLIKASTITPFLKSSILSDLFSLMKDICMQYDSPNHPVELELWLLLGGDESWDCFSILDTDEASVSPVIVKSSANSVMPEDFADRARYYVQRKQAHLDRIRQLLSGKKNGNGLLSRVFKN